MKKITNIPINYSIAIIIAVFSINFVIFLIIFFSTKVFEQKVIDCHNYLNQLSITNQHIIKYQDDFFISNRNTYLEKSDQTQFYFENIQKAKLELDTLQLLKINRKKIQLLLNELQDQFAYYHSNVQKILDLNSEIYMPEIGLNEKYKVISQKIYAERKFYDLNLIPFFDTLKLNSNLMFSGQITKREYQLKSRQILKSIDNQSNISNQNDTYSFFIDYFSDYFNTTIVQFNKIESIGQNYNEGLLAALKMSNTLILNDINELTAETTHLQNIINIRYIALFSIFVIIFIALIAMIILYFYRKIYPDIIEIKQKTNEMASGQLPSISLHSFIFEINQIQNNLGNVSNNFKQKKNIIDRLIKHNYAIEFDIKNDDEIGKSLISLVEELQKSEKEALQYRETEEHQKWTATGIAKIGVVMRQYTDNINNLAKNILRETLEFVDAVQGIIYVYNRENLFLEQAAAYSYGKQRLKNIIIKPYEGLIGTILVEKKSYYLDPIPEDYIFFETGFGSGKPTSLFAFPLLFENTIYGVFEIASMEAIPDYKRNFLLLLADEIANTFSYVEINMRTKQLLDQSNKQAEELISNQKLFKKNQENLKSLLRMTEEHLNEREEILKDREKMIKEKVEIILQLEKENAEKDDVVENITTEFENIRLMQENRIKELSKKIDDLQRRINDSKE